MAAVRESAIPADLRAPRAGSGAATGNGSKISRPDGAHPTEAHETPHRGTRDTPPMRTRRTPPMRTRRTPPHAGPMGASAAMQARVRPERHRRRPTRTHRTPASASAARAPSPACSAHSSAHPSYAHSPHTRKRECGQSAIDGVLRALTVDDGTRVRPEHHRRRPARTHRGPASTSAARAPSTACCARSRSHLGAQTMTQRETCPAIDGGRRRGGAAGGRPCRPRRTRTACRRRPATRAGRPGTSAPARASGADRAPWSR
jgi:hypothetical protein